MSTETLSRLAALGLFVIPVAIALAFSAHIALGSSPNRSEERTAVFVAFCIYVAAVGAATLAPPPMSMGNGRFGTNLVPLIYSLRCFTPNPGQPSTTRFCLETIVGNVALFIPLGALLPLVSSKRMSSRKVFLIAMSASVAIELLQYAGRWVGNARWSDVDDVIFNVAGAMAGYALLHALLNVRSLAWGPTRNV